MAKRKKTQTSKIKTIKIESGTESGKDNNIITYKESNILNAHVRESAPAHPGKAEGTNLINTLPDLNKDKAITIDLEEEVVDRNKSVTLKANKFRPALTITYKQVLDLAKIHCTVAEIGSVLGCSRETIHTHFQHALREGSECGQQSLKHAMHKKAINQNDGSMQIWLSKQRLGYKDKQPDEAPQVNFNVMVNEVPK